MSEVIAFPDSPMLLTQISYDIGAFLSDLRDDTLRAQGAWLCIGERFLAARQELPADQDFGRWCDGQIWADEIGPHNRAAAMRLALNRERAWAILSAMKCESVSPRYMLARIEEVIAASGAEPLRSVWSRSQTDTISESIPEATESAASVAKNAKVAAENVGGDTGSNPRPRKSRAVTARMKIGLPQDLAERCAAYESKGSDALTEIVRYARRDTQAEAIEFVRYLCDGIDVGTFTLAQTQRVASVRLVLPTLSRDFVDDYRFVIERRGRKEFDVEAAQRFQRDLPWLQKAIANQWSGPQMRHAMREAAPRPAPMPMPEAVASELHDGTRLVPTPIRVCGMQVWPRAGDLPYATAYLVVHYVRMYVIAYQRDETPGAIGRAIATRGSHVFFRSPEPVLRSIGDLLSAIGIAIQNDNGRTAPDSWIDCEPWRPPVGK